MIVEIKRILFPVSSKTSQTYALDYAITFAKQFNATIIVMHVIERVPCIISGKDREKIKIELENEAKQLIKPYINKIVEENVNYEVDIVIGEPENEIFNEIISKYSDIIIMGTLGKSLSNLFSSLTKNVLENSTIPVLVVDKDVK